MTTLKTQTRLWALYDFANSLAFVNVSFYFGLWFVSDLHLSTIWVSVPVALATTILFFTLPAFGRMSDRMHKRMPFLGIFSLLSILSLGALGWIGATMETSGENGMPAASQKAVISMVILYFLFQYFYQAALAFYYSFIHDLAQEKTKEKVSGFGMAAGQIGNIIGLILVFPVAQGKFPIFGFSGRPAALIAAAICFFLCLLPVLFGLKDRSPQTQEVPTKLGQSLKEAIQGLKNIRHYPGVLRYLCAYYFFADAILTLQLFASLYLEKVGKLGDGEKTIAFIFGIFFAVIGALASSKIAEKIKSTRKAILIFIGFWAILIGLFAFAEAKWIFMGVLALNGFAFGGLFALSSAFFSRIIPAEKHGELFSIYVLFERFASVLGPLVWSLTIAIFVSLGEIMQFRLAMFSLAILVAISFAIMRGVKEPSSTAA
jgi:UMF1 family MFS transporter